ncbi:MAG: hypothetical protein CVU11_01525 [Bacteroidetes bacterium HGW-Bacteroidetes-6]|jgi:hypothetical protein|nr:MAG: hypothetical protein CVU11_01525 [Bacteroidetes bacterium HGW-Bacteroidetes-6]
MKKILFLIAFLPLFVYAQKFSICPFYSSAGGLQPTTWSRSSDHTTVTIDTSITTFSYESFQVSLGKGTRFGISSEYKWKDLISIGASVSYFKSKDTPIKYSSSAEYDPYTIYNIKYSYTEIYRNKSIDLGLYCHVIFKDKNVTPYTNAGLILSYSKFTLNREIYIQNNLPGYYPTERYIYDYNISPSFHYGMSGSLGIEFNRNGIFTFFIEANSLIMNVSPRTRTCTGKTWNSEDQFSTMTTSEIELEYVDSYSDENSQNPNEPSQALKFNQSFSSAGILGGIKYNF